MSDANEPSYYEIALTSRQVLASFVVLLGCVLVAFGMGVWVGRMDGAPRAAGGSPPPPPALEGEDGELASLEEFQFPSAEAEGGLRRPDLSELRSDPGGDPPSPEPARPPRETTLSEDVGNPPPRAAPPPAAPAPAPPPPPRAPPRQPAPPPPAAEPAEGFVVQVFSTRDEDQAKKVLARLRQGGHQAFLSPVQVGGQTMYRVRIGPFERRAPAENAATAIRNEYRLETWVTAASN